MDYYTAKTLAGNPNRVRALFKDYRDLVFSRDDGGWTHLHLAALHGHTEMAKLLLANGADVNARNTLRLPPLHYAVWNNKKDMVLLLLANGADVDAKDEIYGTPLQTAIKRGHSDVAKLLADWASRPSVKIDATIRMGGV